MKWRRLIGPPCIC